MATLQLLDNQCFMEIEKINFSTSHIPDNDASYLALLEGMVNSVDEYSTMAITSSPTGYYFRISPSSPKYINLLMDQLTSMNKYFGIMLNFSKSMKSSGVISWNIPKFVKN